MKIMTRLGILISTILLLSSCSTPLLIKVNASSHLNPDEQDRSLPVELVIYQLEDDQVFRQATFQELWQGDSTTLGTAMLSRREVNIPPSTKTKIKLDRQEEATYIGVLAIFRNPENGSWRAIKKIGKGVPLTAKHLQLNLQGNHVRFR